MEENTSISARERLYNKAMALKACEKAVEDLHQEPADEPTGKAGIFEIVGYLLAWIVAGAFGDGYRDGPNQLIKINT